MAVLTISNEAEYKIALSEISPYFDQEPDLGTPEAKRFEELANAIGAYEDIHYPISPRNPSKNLNWEQD